MPQTIGELLFSHAHLPVAAQRLVLDRLPDYRDALGSNEHLTDQDAWRACYPNVCPADRARGLLGNASLRPDDVEWVLFTPNERRSGPLDPLRRTRPVTARRVASRRERNPSPARLNDGADADLAVGRLVCDDGPKLHLGAVALC